MPFYMRQCEEGIMGINLTVRTGILFLGYKQVGIKLRVIYTEIYNVM